MALPDAARFPGPEPGRAPAAPLLNPTRRHRAQAFLDAQIGRPRPRLVAAGRGRTRPAQLGRRDRAVRPPAAQLATLPDQLRASASPAALGTRSRLPVVARATRLVAAVGLVAVVLVVVRQPALPAVSDRLDEGLADTLLAERVSAVAGWAITVSTLLVLGGAIFRTTVEEPVRRRLRRQWSSPAWRRRAMEDHRAQVTTGDHRSTSARFLRAASFAGVVAAAVAIVLRTSALKGAWLAAWRDPSTLWFVLTTRFGDALLLRAAGLLTVAWVSSVPNRPVVRPPGRAPSTRLRVALPRLGLLAGGLLILASYARVGHPQATTGPGPLLVASQATHVLVAATWFGGVTLLAMDLRQRHRLGDPRGSAEVMRSFSTVAGVAVAIAGATGLVLARSQLPELSHLWSTAYGRALTAKLGCVATVVAVGAYNRQWLVPAVVRQTDDQAAWRRLRRTLVAEALIMTHGILLATAALTSGGL